MFYRRPSAQEAEYLGWSGPWLGEISALTALYSIHWLSLRMSWGPTVVIVWLHGHTDSLLATTEDADTDSSFLRLKKSQKWTLLFLEE